jgi:hypothetical protein
MKSPTRTAKLGFRDRLIDTYIESYVEWREGCADLYCAYRRWTQSEPPDRDLALLAYRAALDREEKAALVYELAAGQLARRAGDRLMAEL